MQRPLMLAALLCAAAMALTTADAFADDPVGATAAQTEVVLKRGDRGPAVETLQRALNVGADGVFGRVTARAVRAFQREHGLTVDGVVGPQTRAALGLRPFSARAVTRRKPASAPEPPSSVKLPAVLIRIAECESGGDPTALSPGGTYRGKYQFHPDTWAGLGGEGDPAKASEAEQDRLALKLYKQQGTAPWPACGS